MKRVFLDEGDPRQLRTTLLNAGFSVSSVQLEGWQQMGNGELLARLEGDFDVLLTNDKRMASQQSLSGRGLSIVVLPTNRKAIVISRAADITDTLVRVAPGQLVVIEASGQRSVRQYDEAATSYMPAVERFEQR